RILFHCWLTALRFAFTSPQSVISRLSIDPDAPQGMRFFAFLLRTTPVVAGPIYRRSLMQAACFGAIAKLTNDCAALRCFVPLLICNRMSPPNAPSLGTT